MKKRLLLLTLFVVAIVSLFAISASAAAPKPTKPDLGVSFGEVTEIDGFTPPSQLYVNTTERVLLTDGNGNYVTYPTYYITKDSTTFDVDFGNLNNAQSVQYTKASIVMLEVPNGITTITASYFAGSTNFASCIYVQFPGTVTSYGRDLFGSYNDVIRAVEFLDGTESITMEDQMFGSQWNGGANSIEYVKFPNNLVSIGNNTFGKAKGVSKTVIFGENLKSIGTGFFGESTPNTTDTFLYISENFYADTSTLVANIFGTSAPYHGNNLRLTIFYTGTKAQAEALVAAGAALQTGYVFNNATLVSASEYVYETHKPTKDLSATIVYGYGKCDAFYDGHIGEDYDCTTDNTCTRCNTAFPKQADNHTVVESLVYANGFDNVGLYNCYCTNDNCTMAGAEIVDEETEAIIVAKGYSVPLRSQTLAINAGFDVKTDLLKKFEELNPESTVTIGLAMVNAETAISAGAILDGEELATNVKGFVVKVASNSYSSISIEIKGFEDNGDNTGSYYDLKLITVAYVKIDDEIHYIQHGGSATTTETIGDVAYKVVTANSVYTATT